MSKSQQLDFLLVLLRATVSCKNIDFRLAAAKCRRAVAAASTRYDREFAVEIYESDRARIIRNVFAFLPQDESDALSAAFDAGVDFQNATHAASGLAS